MRATFVLGALLTLTAAMVLGTAISAAQSKPDFSGEFVLNRPASTLSPSAEAFQSGTVRIEHRDAAFRYKAELVAPTGPVRYEYELPSDGREVTSTLQGATSASTLRWDGDALVLTSRIQRAGGEMVVSFRYELLDGGRRLRGVERIRGGGRDQDNVWIFDRVGK